MSELSLYGFTPYKKYFVRALHSFAYLWSLPTFSEHHQLDQYEMHHFDWMVYAAYAVYFYQANWFDGWEIEGLPG